MGPQGENVRLSNVLNFCPSVTENFNAKFPKSFVVSLGLLFESMGVNGPLHELIE